MYSDAYHFCRSCLTCASYQVTGRKVRALLHPIPVNGAFERVGMDILEMPLTTSGNKCIVVFVDYFTKWVEAYPNADQTTETIVQLLIDNIVCHHGIVVCHGQNLLSGLIKQVCAVLGMTKLNTTTYHPQTDGLVENVNKTLRSMIAKCVHTLMSSGINTYSSCFCLSG